MKKRIVGIDVARALAVIGMIIVNFRMVFGEQGDSWLSSISHVFDGKAAATFVVLAGIGLALMSNSALKDQNVQKLEKVRNSIIKKSIFLFVIGLSYMWIWPADILHFYGIYMLVTLLFIYRSPRQILLGVTGVILIYPILLLLFKYENGWDFSVLEYKDFWTITGFFRNLFYNGFHPVLPWVAFMLFGLWYGKQKLHDERFLRKSLYVSLIVFILTQVASFALIRFISQGNPDVINNLTPILGTDPMPPMPLYMINGISISIVIISACILMAHRYEKNIVVIALNKTGQLALTFYVAHVILGMGIVEEIGSKKLGAYSIEFSTTYAVVFSLICMLFAQFWLKYKTSGPLEFIMRKLAR